MRCLLTPVGRSSTYRSISTTAVPRWDSESRYSTDLFKASTIERMVGHYFTLLRELIDHPERSLAQAPLLTVGEREQILYGFNLTAREYPREAPLAELIEAQVAATPDATAVVFEGKSLSYRELNEQANRLARELVKHGAKPDELVGIFVERSVEMVIALLAVMKSGAAYVPLDPNLPKDRLAYMIEDSSLEVLITNKELRDSVPAGVVTVLTLGDSAGDLNSGENLGVEVGPESLAYVIYTSGSTGKPKGVQIPRGALTNFLWSMKEWLKPEAGQAILAVTTISFDIAGLEIWLPLLVGGNVVVVSRETAGNGEELAAVLNSQDVRLAQATPVTWRLLLDSGWAGKPDLVAVCGGEAMPQELAAQLTPMVRRLWNFYGPTETTIWSMGYLIEDGHVPVLIGRPVANTQCYILDEQLQPVPLGARGELYIGGDGLARGYLKQPGLTKEKFVPNPFVPGKRMYRTGDLARYLPNGNIECLGRTDHQVKIRGFRIPSGEIESVLDSHPGVRQSVVASRERPRPETSGWLHILRPRPIKYRTARNCAIC